MIWSWKVVADDLPQLLDGLRVTVEATVAGYLLALVTGLVWTLLRRSRNVVVSQVVRWFVEFIRCTPLLVQLFFLFFVLPHFGLALGALATGIIGLGLHYSAYIAEVYRAGIADVPRGQWEAATALNLPRQRVWFAVVLPQAIRKVIPTLGNYLIAMFKDSPLLLGINVAELLQTAFQEGSHDFHFLEPITMVGVLFVIVSVLSSIFVRRLETRYGNN
jgi:polar amino acid transport system permease protein